jgi:hypothetical protein
MAFDKSCITFSKYKTYIHFNINHNCIKRKIKVWVEIYLHYFKRFLNFSSSFVSNYNLKRILHDNIGVDLLLLNI